MIKHARQLPVAIVLVIVVTLPGPVAVGSEQASIVRLDVDWAEFLRRHDMVWDRLPERWNEAPHFGNARIGSMLYRRGNAVVVQLFHADVQDHRDNTHGWTAYSRPRFGIGSLHLVPVGTIQGGAWRKDLWNAELVGKIRTDRGEIHLRHLVHAEEMVIVTELRVSEGEAGCKWSWHPVKAETTRPGYPRKKEQVEDFAKRYGDQYRRELKLFEPNPEGRLVRQGEVSTWVQDLLHGGQYATAWSESDGEGGHRILLVSVANSYPEKTAHETAIDAVRTAGRSALRDLVNEHRAWWHDYYPRSFLTLPETRLETLYWNTIYRYGCTARRGRAFVATSGLWFQGGNWPYVTTDYNIQAAHWALPAANRLEQSIKPP